MNTLSKEPAIKSNHHQSRNEGSQSIKTMANFTKALEEKPEVQDKRPCSICAKMNFPNRFHPVEKCWNKEKRRVPEMQVHMNDESVEAESADEAQKTRAPGEVIATDQTQGVVANGRREVEAFYDTGSNVSLIDHDLVNKLELNISDDKTIFQTPSGRNFTRGRVKLRLKIGETEETFETCALKNDNFTYDLLLGPDSIK